MIGAIRSALEETQAGEARYYPPMLGVVTDIVDQTGKHRARVAIDGFAEGAGIWCYARGSGGAPAHGAHINAIVGQRVIVQFVGGDPHGIALWEPAWWAEPAAGSEAPDAFRGLPPEDAAQIHALEVTGFAVSIDARAGKRQLVIVDRELDSMIQINGEIGQIVVRGSVSIKIEAPSVDIDGASVRVNGRTVLVGPAPIA